MLKRNNPEVQIVPVYDFSTPPGSVHYKHVFRKRVAALIRQL